MSFVLHTVSASVLGLAGPAEVVFEYVLGFALRLDDFPGFVYARDGRGFLFPFIDQHVHPGTTLDEPVDGRDGPDSDGVTDASCVRGQSCNPAFWLVMSIGLLVGFVIAYPMNWWLVANHLKHGMMTVRRASMFGTMQDHDAEAGARHDPHIGHQAAMEAKSTLRPGVR